MWKWFKDGEWTQSETQHPPADAEKVKRRQEDGSWRIVGLAAEEPEPEADAASDAPQLDDVSDAPAESDAAATD